MKFTVDKNDLLTALRPCVDVADEKSPAAFGKHVLLSIGALGALEMRADKPQHLSIRTTVDAVEVHQVGSVAVPAKDLLSRVDSVPEGRVTLDTTGSTVSISVGAKRYHQLRYTDAKSFPAYPTRPTTTTRVAAATLASVLSRVIYAANPSAIEAGQYGALLVGDGARLAAYASNGGRRLAMAEEPSGARVDAFVTKDAVKVMQKMLGGANKDIEAGVATSETHVHLYTERAELAYSRPYAAFPPYHEFFAFYSNKVGSIVDRAALLEAVHRVTPDGTSHESPVRLLAHGGTIDLLYVSREGEVSEDAVARDGEQRLEAVIEGRYLIDALGAIGSDRVELWSDVGHPLIIRGDQAAAAVGQLRPEAMRQAKEAA